MPHLDDAMLIEHPLPDCNIVIFGATGDLTHRKLMPALFSIETQGLLPPNTKIIGFARRAFSDQTYREEIKAALMEFAPELWREGQASWKKFSQRIVFHRSEFDNTHGYQWLKDRLNDMDSKNGVCGNRLFLSRHAADYLLHHHSSARRLGPDEVRRCPGQRCVRADHRREAVRHGS